MANKSRPTFPLRLRSERVRALVQVVAERERVSQNELIEEAVEHELVLRGAMLAEDLELIVERLHSLADGDYEALVERSLLAAVAGEAQAEPITARALHAGAHRVVVDLLSDSDGDPLGALSAFHDAQH